MLLLVDLDAEIDPIEFNDVLVEHDVHLGDIASLGDQLASDRYLLGLQICIVSELYWSVVQLHLQFALGKNPHLHFPLGHGLFDALFESVHPSVGVSIRVVHVEGARV